MKKPWTSMRRILAIRLDAMGDVLMTSPALRAIKESLNHGHLTLLTSPAAVPAARLIPEIDEVWSYEAPWMKATPPRADASQEWEEIHKWQKGRFDGAVIFTVYSQNPLPAALMCHYAGIPHRLAHCRENPYQLLTHWVPDDEPTKRVRHEVRRQLDLVEAAGFKTTNDRLSLRPTLRAYRRMRDHLHEVGLRMDRPWLLVHPGASAPSRRYPPESYARAARGLAEELGYQIVFTGEGSDVALVSYIQKEMGTPSFSLAGRLNLDELAALIGEAALLVANNTGPAHIAAAMGTPVVSLYALTNPQHTPWKVPTRVLFHDVSCRYCYKSVCPEGHHDCLRRVEPHQITEAARALLPKESLCTR